MPILEREVSLSKKDRSGGILKIFFVLLLAMILTVQVMVMLSSEQSGISPQVPAIIKTNSHTPIYIDGNSGFTNASGVGWGSGAASDPYIIEDWDINASSANGIWIQNTDAHFIIRNCYIHDGGEDYSGIWLDNSTNGTLTNNTCSNNDYGIYLQSSSNNTLSNNTCNWNNYIGIFLRLSSNDTLSNNNCSSNNDYGICLEQSSNDTLSNNNCSSNDDYGIILYSSSNNEIIWNQICNNSFYGVTTDSLAFDNRIWNNTFIGNNGTQSSYDPDYIQANDIGTNNKWNSSGYGNYWSDWTTPDDVSPWGIVDNPYIIDGGAMDYYPQTTIQVIPEPPIFILTAIMIMIFLIFGRIREKNK